MVAIKECSLPYGPVLGSFEETRRLERIGLEKEFHLPLNRSPLPRTIFLVQIFLSITKIVGVLPSLFMYIISPKKIKCRTTTFSIKLGKCSFDVVVLQRTAEKPTRLYFARAVSLFCL